MLGLVLVVIIIVKYSLVNLWYILPSLAEGAGVGPILFHELRRTIQGTICA